MQGKLFSERHARALREKRLKIGLKTDLRRSLYRLMQRYSEWGGWDNVDNLTVDAVVQRLLDRHGWSCLLRWDGKAMQPVEGFEDFVIHGVPSHVLDAVELFRGQLDFKKTQVFTSDLNTIFELHHSPLRYFRAEYYVIDSAFLESQVLAEAQQLLNTNAFGGALEEFLRARSAFTEKDFKATILMANHALESALKTILGVERKKTAELIKKACRNGLVPSYYEGFLDHFQEFLEIVPTTRTNEAGHGQGKEIKEVPAALAELALHLSGSLIVFLVKRHIEQSSTDEDDVPF